MRHHTNRLAAAVVAAGLIVAACGSDDDSNGADSDEPAPTQANDAVDTAPSSTAADAAGDTEPSSTEADPDGTEPSSTQAEGDDEAGAESGDELATEGDVEIASGTALNLDECPDDWDPMQGVTDDEILIGISLPQSGPLAAFGDIGAGIEMYFDFVNDTDPIEGKNLVLVAKDDAYEAGRTAANVQEMIDSDGVFAFTHIIGTPNNLAARPITDEACVPQLFNSTGFPLWGDPANWPWTTGNILNYATETDIWCAAINAEFPDGATVAALIDNNDFGKTYQNSLQDCEGIDVVAEQLHAPDAPDITNEMTTLIGSNADVLIGGTTGAYCPQAAAALAGSDWRPRFYNSYTCSNLASFYAPVKDAIATLGDSAPILTNANKVCGDPQYNDDPAIQRVQMILNDYGNGTTCEDGSFSTGILFGEVVEDVMRSAAARPGGVNRVNLMAAAWNADFPNDQLLGGSFKTDGVNDAYFTEAAQPQQIVIGDDGNLTFENRGDPVSLEGEGGSYEG